MDALSARLLGLAGGAMGTSAFPAIGYLDIAGTRRRASVIPGRTAVARIGRDAHDDRDPVRRVRSL